MTEFEAVKELKKVLPEELKKYHAHSPFSIKSKACLVGSTVTCDPIPETADIDILFQFNSNMKTNGLMDFFNDAEKIGFYIDGEDYEHHVFIQNMSYEEVLDYLPENEDFFVSLKRPQDNLNLIVTVHYKFWSKFILATRVCRDLNLLEKKHRITLFQAILYQRHQCYT